MRIYNYKLFLEKKLYIYNRKCRIKDIIDANIYDIEQVNKWMSIYNIDTWAHCILVSENKIKSLSNVNIRVSSRDIKNKVSFDDNSQNTKGYLVEDSKLELGEDTIYLYIFKKNSNPTSRARQNHGFTYEYEIRQLNGLNKLGNTHKWDAQGGLDLKFIEDRSNSDIKYFNGNDYEEFNWDFLPSEFKKENYWNIKSIEYGNNVDMGDFLRVAGWKLENGKLIKQEDRVSKFMFVVNFYNKIKGSVEEYIILMPIDKWFTYFPDIYSYKKEIESMYSELKSHRLKGERTEESELGWKNFLERYKKITENSLIKLRFKRDSKGQLRIQCSISFKDFKKILENKHIKISK